MPEYLELKDALCRCKKEGKFIEADFVDIHKIKSTLDIAEGDISSANRLIADIDNSPD